MIYSREDMLYYGCSEELVNKIMELSDTEMYTCINDNECGNFKVDCKMSKRDWVGWALETLFVDDCNVEQDILGNNDKCISYIEDYWNITIVNNMLLDFVEYYLDTFDIVPTDEFCEDEFYYFCNKNGYKPNPNDLSYVVWLIISKMNGEWE